MYEGGQWQAVASIDFVTYIHPPSLSSSTTNPVSPGCKEKQGWRGPWTQLVPAAQPAAGTSCPLNLIWEIGTYRKQFSVKCNQRESKSLTLTQHWPPGWLSLWMCRGWPMFLGCPSPQTGKLSQTCPIWKYFHKKRDNYLYQLHHWQKEPCWWEPRLALKLQSSAV